jgi:hypothetical protein
MSCGVLRDETGQDISSSYVAFCLTGHPGQDARSPENGYRLDTEFGRELPRFSREIEQKFTVFSV